jgi:hypothetical protein
MSESPLREVVQVSFATHDLDRLMRLWNDKYGVGPWEVLDFTADRLTNATVGGQPVEYGMRLARARLGKNVVIELMEPLDDRSIYATSLKRHNGADHVHHIMCTTADYDETLEHYAKLGIGNAMGGNFNGLDYAYLNTVEDLGIWIELSKVPADFVVPQADQVYPPDAAAFTDRRSSGQS